MADFFYLLIVFPLEQIIELGYSFVYRVFEIPALSLIGVSVIVSTLTLPLYFMAEKYQQAERDTQKALQPEIDRIRACYKGDQRFMILSACYRENHYHPVYALRTSLSLFIQIPFFIAAYHFLSNLEELRGVSFAFINDLGASDAAFQAGDFTVNILPVLMTVINCVSGAIYTRGFPLKEKIQLYGMAAVFLVLLYHSPSGLVLYWTCNNLYSLVKNLLQKAKNPGRIVYFALAPAALVVACFVLFFHTGAFAKRAVVAGLCVLAALAPPVKKAARRVRPLTMPSDCALTHTRAFVFSCAALCLLAGLVIPASVISSSVSEFSYLTPYTSPLAFVGITLTEAAGFFFWALCVFFLFGRRVKTALTLGATLFLTIAVLDTFCFGGDYGFMTPNLRLSDFRNPTAVQNALNLIAITAACAAVCFLLTTRPRRKAILFTVQSIAIAAFLVFGIINAAKIPAEFAQLPPPASAEPVQLEPVYTFSRTGKNVLIIFLDRGIPGYVPSIFEEKPELRSSFSGFTLFPNTVSFGGHTVFGAPPIYGGYDYTPLAIQKRSSELLLSKYYEAMRTLPKIMADAGFTVSVGDQPDMDNSLYRAETNITAENLIGKYTGNYLSERRDMKPDDYVPLLRTNLIRFSCFKFSPLFLRGVVYEVGGYYSMEKTKYSAEMINNYTSLYYLSAITQTSGENRNQSILLYNMLPHRPAFLEAPLYEPMPEITNRGKGPFADKEDYHVNMASFLLLARWFDFLKTNGVWDNTRIIIVSDHGFSPTGRIPSHFSNEIILPNEDSVESYNCLLMVKDFGANGDVRIDNTFMTNADVPLLATWGIVENPVNPFTGSPLAEDKTDGVTITTSHLWEISKQKKYTFDIKPNEWLHVRDNIFDLANWSRVTP